MRILYVGNSGGLENSDRFYLFPQRIINGLIRNGHFVQIFNDKDVARLSNPFKSSRLGINKTNNFLLKNCHDFQPNLVIISHCQFIKNETLSDIRKICQNVKIIHLNVDPLSETKNRNTLNKRLDNVDGIFITTAGDALKEFSTHSTFSAFIPNLVDDSIDIGRAFENKNCDTDLFFAAGAMRTNDHRQSMASDIIKNLPHIKMDIYGAGINNKKIFGHNYLDKLSSSKMGLIINKTEDYYLYSSDRMTHYMANGLMVFAHESPRYQDVLGNDTFVSYHSTPDLIDKIKYYYTHDAERIRIAQNGYEKIHQVFHQKMVTEYLVDMSFNTIRRQYPWPTEKFGGNH